MVEASIPESPSPRKVLALLFLLPLATGAVGFLSGRLSVLSSAPTPIIIADATNTPSVAREGGVVSDATIAASARAVPVSRAGDPAGPVVASKNGTKYHLPTCSGARTISEKNLITFASAAEARAAGYAPASNCKGL